MRTLGHSLVNRQTGFWLPIYRSLHVLHVPQPDSGIVISLRLASWSLQRRLLLLAIPFFVVMGALMNAGGLTTALVRVAQSLVGHWRGGPRHWCP